MSTFATLRTLHTLIGDALGEIERVYGSEAEVGGPLLDYPSLDVPYYKTASHDAHEDAAEKLTSNPAVVNAANRIVAACGQLAASVHRPFFQLTEAVMADHIASCLTYLEASHTVEILRAAGPNGLHVRDIASAIDGMRAVPKADLEPTDPSKLSHILRLLATHHWLREVGPDIFANNRLSALVDTGKTMDQLRETPHKKYDDTDGIAALVAMKGDDFLKSVAHMTDHLLPERERSVISRKLLDGDHNGQRPAKYKTPFNLAFRTELGYFDWLELSENKSRLAEFGRAMTGARGWEVTENIIDAYPWKDLPRDSVVIDVGGGIGSTSVVLAKAYPHLRFVVEDRQPVVEIAPSVLGPAQAELIQSGRVSFKTHSFFDPQPPTIEVPGVGSISSPSVFVIRGCTHNWPDADVEKIFRHLRAAAAPTTELLIVDMILPLACVEDAEDEEQIPGAERSLVPEGSPLLANLGKASASGYMLDVSMLAMLNAKERTLREISGLARAAGWKVTSMKRAPGSVWAYTSAKAI
ncbi:S-adenosyl-L-methionine-dependent methyltransferase [Pilatotrama ljubarskyi]|nr:S-adenosyl-L-methionine-dependent methyltransferase [Pilatotrama ljubarskyi]